jgi:hypothetical protein
MSARDIEFVDLEADGDLDVFVAAHTNGGGSAGGVSRFFTNLGGVQLGPEAVQHHLGALAVRVEAGTVELSSVELGIVGVESRCVHATRGDGDHAPAQPRAGWGGRAR